MTDPALLSDLLAALQYLLLERLEPGRFRVVGIRPDWVDQVFPSLGDLTTAEQMTRHSPFLGHFISEAEGFWQLVPSGGGKLSSGIWTEADDGEFPLEASALRVAGHSLLVIQSVRGVFKEKQHIIQTGRNARLRQERNTPPEGIPGP